jgi:GNAT superfamily N-acetyltransferase
MEFEKACLSDLEEIDALFKRVRKKMEEEGNRTWSGGYPTKGDFRDDLLFKDATILRKEGEIVAYIAMDEDLAGSFFPETKSPAKIAALLRQIEYEEGYTVFSLHRLMVDPLFQGQGIAHRLFDELQKKAPKSILVYAVYPENRKAILSYEHQGFHNLGLDPDFEYGGTSCLLFYRKRDSSNPE